MRKKLVLVAGAVVFGTLALASPAMACGDMVASAVGDEQTGGLPTALDDSSALGSPGSIAVPTSVE